MFEIKFHCRHIIKYFFVMNLSDLALMEVWFFFVAACSDRNFFRCIQQVFWTKKKWRLLRGEQNRNDDWSLMIWYEGEMSEIQKEKPHCLKEMRIESKIICVLGRCEQQKVTFKFFILSILAERKRRPYMYIIRAKYFEHA